MTNQEFQRLVLEKLGNIELELKETKIKLGELDNVVTELNKKATGLDDKVTELDNKISRIDSKVSEIDNNVTTLEKITNAIKEQTAILTEFREEANNKLDALIEDNKSIHEIIGDHEISIRTLRRRTI